MCPSPERVDLPTLSAAAGEAWVEHDPVSVDGVEVDGSWAPADAAAVARALARLAAAGGAALPRGAGTQTGYGNPPSRADCFLSTERLDDIDTLDASEGVCRAGAGIRLTTLRSAVAEAGWELPLDAATESGTLGGALATSRLTPRCQGWGRPRDVVLGLEVALAQGELTRCGGRVVKNVTGYDLAKLYLGSLGSLGVLCSAWLRLRPRPRRIVRLVGEVGSETLPRVLDWSRRAAVRACVVSGTRGSLRVCVELAGEEASVDQSERDFATEGFVPSSDEEVALAGPFPAPRVGLHFRWSLLPTRLADVVAPLLATGARVRAAPGLASVEADVPLSPDEAFRLAAEVADQGGGRWRCEGAPISAKADRDVFGPTPAEVALGRALKTQFDPVGVLNPGRMAGRV